MLTNGKSLVPYEPDEPALIEEALAENDLLDPERPPSLTKTMSDMLRNRWSAALSAPDRA
jgi:phospholipase D1/2